MTVFGTSPEIIRLSVIMRLLDQQCQHVTVHTGQNFDKSLSDSFLRDLNVRTPDIQLGIRTDTFADQASQILIGVDNALTEEQPIVC